MESSGYEVTYIYYLSVNFKTVLISLKITLIIINHIKDKLIFIIDLFKYRVHFLYTSED